MTSSQDMKKLLGSLPLMLTYFQLTRTTCCMRWNCLLLHNKILRVSLRILRRIHYHFCIIIWLNYAASQVSDRKFLITVCVGVKAYKKKNHREFFWHQSEQQMPIVFVSGRNENSKKSFRFMSENGILLFCYLCWFLVFHRPHKKLSRR